MKVRFEQNLTVNGSDACNMPSFCNCFIIFFLSMNHVFSQNLDDVKDLHHKLFQGYNKEVRPIENHHDALNINVTYQFVQLIDIDELQETMVSIATLAIHWIDVSLKWDVSLYNGIDFIHVPQNRIWKPDFLLENAAEKIKEMGLPSYYVGINAEGHVHWDVYDIFTTRCSLDLTYYPFDIQKCYIKLEVWSYFPDEIKLTSLSIEKVVGIHKIKGNKGNSIWNVQSIQVITLPVNAPTTLTYQVTLKRKSSFFVLNILIPVAILGFIGTFVFVIPVDAGEKIGFSTTIFLSFAVFLTILSSDLPHNSDTVVIINIYIMLENGLSVLVLVVTTFQTRLRHRLDPGIPRFYRGVIRLSRYLSCKSNKINAGIDGGDFSKEEDTDINNISWTEVTNAIDMLCFVFFLIIQIAVNMGFIGYLVIR